MAENVQSISAFAVHAEKRKNIKQLSKNMNKKQCKKLQEISTFNKDFGMRKIKQTGKKIHSKYKRSSKAGINVASKKNGSKKTKHVSSVPTEKKTLIENSVHNSIEQSNTERNIHNVCKESQLKTSKKGKKKNQQKNVSKNEILRARNTNPHDHGSKLSSANNIQMKKAIFMENPIVISHEVFEWMLSPIKANNFFAQNWERTPVHIKRNKSDYYKSLVSTPLLDEVLRENHILFTRNIDITSYCNGVRETHNPPGRALPSVVWDYYQNNCSVRMLNPQTFIPKLHTLNATLQEFFGCFVGSNLYLTPPNSQGFAPHYDDIEAFILQVEGKKRWRLYKPLNSNEYLSRYPSKNYDQSEIGEPILDTVVNAGDLLYFPRGAIHQGETFDNCHSLHITLSVYQKNSWCDLFEKLLPEALTRATETDSRFREGLPLDYLRYVGVVHSTNNDPVREDFKTKIKDLFIQLLDYIDIDKTADLMAKHHIHDFLPPVLTPHEQKCSVAKDGEIMTANGIVENSVEIQPGTLIRLLRSHCIRIIKEDNICKIYYSTENSKEYHEYEPQYLEILEEFVPAVREIIVRYPEFMYVEELPIDGEDNKVQIAKDLWEKGLIITEVPLCTVN